MGEIKIRDLVRKIEARGGKFARHSGGHMQYLMPDNRIFTVVAHRGLNGSTSKKYERELVKKYGG